MTSEFEMSFTCHSCGSDVDVHSDEPNAACMVCGADHILADHLCPNCQIYHDSSEGLCTACGTALTRICRNCHGSNWSGFGFCLSCGAEIDLLSTLTTSSEKSTADRLSRQMMEAQDIKKIEEQSSNKRMAELLAIEEARQAELRQRIAKQKQQEKQMLAMVFGAVALFLIIVIIFTIMTSL